MVQGAHYILGPFGEDSHQRLPSARPIACNDCPAFQRRHISARCVAESFHRLACVLNTTFRKKDLYQVVLHRPVEPARLFGKWALAASPVGRLRPDSLSRREERPPLGAEKTSPLWNLLPTVRGDHHPRGRILYIIAELLGWRIWRRTVHPSHR
jgi:hypothetical protein